MVFWLDLFVFAFAALRQAFRILRWSFSPRRAEARRFEELRAHGVYHRLDSNAMGAFITGLTYLYAAFLADLGMLWGVLAAVDLATGGFLLSVRALARRRSLPEPAPKTALTQEHLDRLVRRRVVSQRIRVGILLLWIFSWRHLFLA
jgi:hypothetical protein